MNIDVTGIFQTYIAHTHVSDHELISRHILGVMNNVPQDKMHKKFDFWDYCDPSDPVMASFKKSLSAVIESVNNIVENGSASKFEVSRSWAVSIDGHYDQPHHHATSKWTCVFYVSAPEGCGDLLLLDPRGGVYAESNEENGLTNRAYKRITPKTGTLIILPGYLLHMVEPSTSGVKRIAFATLFKEIYA
jgi:hypothetical protein